MKLPTYHQIKKNRFKKTFLIFNSKDSNHEIVESLLNALTKLCTTYFKECFNQICILGERIIPSLLNIFNSKQTDSVKVIDFHIFSLHLLRFIFFEALNSRILLISIFIARKFKCNY